MQPTQTSQTPTPSLQVPVASLSFTQPSQATTPSIQASLPLTQLSQPSQGMFPSTQASLPLTQPSQDTTPSLTQSTQLATPATSGLVRQASQVSVEAQPADVDASAERMEWNDALVESLLYLRMHKYGLCFKGSKSKAQLAAAWYRILMEFNSENHRVCKVDQLKNKFQALKTTYNNIKASEPQTGNSTENPIVYPSNWPTLIQYFGDLSGMGNRDFGQTTGNTEAASGTAAVTEGAVNKRAARKRKLDLAEAVVSMAEALSKRLGQPVAADNRAEHSIDSKFARVEEHVTSILSNQEQSMRMLQASIEESRQVNTAILAFLQATVTPEKNAEHEQQTNTP